ncbi:MAG: hypothetical protein II864_07345 [Prevotella sp.]|jgi:hypothetical protein|nr:hypothetical protein [Prevotella sp.]
MPKKKAGFLYEVHPTPAKGSDGRNIVYARPARGMKLSIDAVDDYCARHHCLRSGELKLAMGEFLKAAGALMARGYRIDTPIGSFAPKLALRREVTDPDEVRDSDVVLDGVDYIPGKHWDEAIGKWMFDGFSRLANPNTQAVVGDTEHLEQALAECLKRGYVTTRSFASRAGLTQYSARKVLEAWTKGDNPKLMRSKMGQLHIYTEI